MARLPTVGGDKGNWGDILNEYLAQSLADDGTLKTDTVGAAQLKPNSVTNAAIVNGTISTAKLNGIGAASGIASLDGSALLPESQVPIRLTDAELSAKIAAAIQAIPATAQRSFYLGNKFAFLGDSITWGYPGGKNAWCDYAALFSGGRIQRIKNAGVSANHTADMLARLDVDIISKGVNACTVLGGINDTLANVAPATTQANLAAIYSALEAAGVRPVLMCVLANTNANSAQKAAIIALNNWIKAYGLAHGHDVIDLYDMSRDPSTGGMLASWTADGTHPGLAYQIIGRAVSDFMSPRLPVPNFTLATASTERRNLIDNALMLVDTNTDGIPDNFTGSNGSGFTHSILAPAVGTDVAGNWATVTMAVGGVARRLEWTSFGRLALGLAFANPGDVIAWAARVSLAPGSDALGASVYAQAEGANVSAAVSALSYSVDGVAYGEFVVPAGFTGRTGIILSTGNGSGVYRLAQPVMLNLTRLNGPAAVIAGSPPVTPGDGLSGTSVNGVVATDTFARSGELVGSSPTTGRAGVVYSGTAAQFSLDGSRANGLGGAGNAVFLDVLATGDTTVSVTERFSTEETVTKTARLYPKYIDASNHIFINMAASTAPAFSVRVTASGVQRTLSTFASTVIPSNTPATEYAVQISVIGTAVSATINGVTLTSTLTGAEVTALAASSKVVFTATSVNHGLDNLSISVNGTYA